MKIIYPYSYSYSSFDKIYIKKKTLLKFILLNTYMIDCICIMNIYIYIHFYPTFKVYLKYSIYRSFISFNLIDILKIYITLNFLFFLI